MTALDNPRPAGGADAPESAVLGSTLSASTKLLRRPTAGSMILAAMLVAGTVIRLLFISSDLNLDEGQWIYDARLFGQGAVPFVDWTTRSPLVLLLTAVAIKALGYTFVAGRVVSILSASATAYLLYLLGRELQSRRAGTVAAAFYLFLPFTIYQTIIVHEHPVHGLLITLAMLTLLFAFRSGRNRFFLLHGILISMAYLVRRSSPAYLLVEPFLCLLLVRNIRRAFGYMIVVALGAIVGLLPLVPLAAMTDWKWMWFSYGPGGLGIAPPPAEDYNQLNLLYNAALFLMPMVALLPAFLLLAMPRISVRRRKVLAAALLVGMLTVFFRLSLLDSWTDRYNTIPISVANQRVGMCLFILSVGSGYLAADGVLVRGRLATSLLLFWFGTMAAFYVILKPVWILDYSMELVPPLCVMAGMVVDAAIRRFSAEQCRTTQPFGRTVRLLPLALGPIYFAFTGLIFLRAQPYARSWSIQGVEEVGQYVAARTQKEEEVFTAGTAFAVAANRPVVLNVSHAAIYYMTKLDDPAPYDPYNVIPSASDIANYLRDNPVRYVIMDGRTRGLVHSFDNLGEVISSCYVEEARFPLATIYRRSNQPVAQSKCLAPGEEADIGQPLHFEYGDSIELLGYDYEPRRFEPDHFVSITLYWRCVQDMNSDWQVALQLLDPEYQLRGGIDRFVGDTGHRTSSWQPGDIVKDTSCLQIGADFVPPAFARIKVAVYRHEGREIRYLPVSAPDRTPIGKEAVFGRVPVTLTQSGSGHVPDRQDVTFGDQIALRGYDLPQWGDAGAPLAIELYWEAVGPVDYDYTVFVHLVDAAGRIVAQADGQPCTGRYPTTLWLPGEPVRDVHVLAPAGAIPTGQYSLLVGIYRLDTLERLPAADTEGRSLPSQQVVIRVAIPSAELSHR